LFLGLGGGGGLGGELSGKREKHASCETEARSGSAAIGCGRKASFEPDRQEAYLGG